MTGDLTLVVIAKEPVPGAVKTRLVPPCTPAEAAAVAEAALLDTLAVVAATPARRRVLAFEGDPGPWLPDGFEAIDQVPGTLDVRIAAVLEMVDGPMVIVGMDTPQLTPARLACDFARHPAWLGAARDGGYWALGLADPDPELVLGVPMSQAYTYREQRRRIEGAGLTVGELVPLRDVDEWSDALAVAASAPETRFGRAVGSIVGSPGRPDQVLDDERH